jgi:hypothetical protein
MLRDWSKHIVGRLEARLAAALNPTVEPGYSVRIFLDDHALRSGDLLTETLREKVQRSALFLAFISPLYLRESWCLDELEWFFAQADKDGRGQRHCTVLRIQPLRDSEWPKRLRDERDRPVAFHDFADSESGGLLPLGFDDFEAPALQRAIFHVQVELLGKLRELRSQLNARRTYQEVAASPVQPVLYLQARREDLPHWQAVRAELKPHAIVYPYSLPEPVGNDALLQQQREERLQEYALCDAIVLLRTGDDDALRIDVMATYTYRQHLHAQRRRNIPWAIVDRVGNAPPFFSIYRVPCVPATFPGWPDQLIRTLGLQTATASSP